LRVLPEHWEEWLRIIGDQSSNADLQPAWLFEKINDGAL
jgi:hypothetical protein